MEVSIKSVLNIKTVEDKMRVHFSIGKASMYFPYLKTGGFIRYDDYPQGFEEDWFYLTVIDGVIYYRAIVLDELETNIINFKHGKSLSN